MHQFLNAHFDIDYANFLGSTLENFRLVYIMVDPAAVDSVSASRCQEHLQDISRRLSGRNAATTVKIIFFELRSRHSIFAEEGQYLIETWENVSSQGQENTF